MLVCFHFCSGSGDVNNEKKIVSGHKYESGFFVMLRIFSSLKGMVTMAFRIFQTLIVILIYNDYCRKWNVPQYFRSLKSNLGDLKSILR